MKIQDIKPNQGKVNIEAVVVEMEPVRDINSNGKSLRVANAIIQDETGKMKLTLWNDEVEKVTVGDKVRITNGFAKEYRDELQLSAGKFGKLEVIGKGDVSKLPVKAPEGKVEVTDDYYDDEEEW